MIPFPDKKYQIIYADPPWSFKNYNNDKSNSNASHHYKCMQIEEIKKLPVSEIANDNCILFMWCTDPLLDKQIQVIEAWGFKYKTVGFYWLKQNKDSSLWMGTGYWTRANPEICLIATKGKPKRISGNVRKVVYSKRGKHSKKPDEVRDRIVKLMGDLPRIELFARPPKDLLLEDESYKGWDVWGNEI